MRALGVLRDCPIASASALSALLDVVIPGAFSLAAAVGMYFLGKEPDSEKGVGRVADDKLQPKLVEYVQDAHAMEQNVSTMLTSMISTTDDPEITEMLEHHKQQTEEHERRLRERLEAMGAGTSTTKAVGGIGAALFKGVGDMARTDKPGKNARDGYMTEHMEIAAYQLLERLARRAGDEQTAEVARKNRADEEAMAQKIDSNWDRFLDLTLATPGFLAE
jgi:ferritin-like metal-binding protein YciE